MKYFSEKTVSVLSLNEGDYIAERGQYNKIQSKRKNVITGQIEFILDPELGERYQSNFYDWMLVRKAIPVAVA